jgi:mono/diheme cytochrome c family protein
MPHAKRAFRVGVLLVLFVVLTASPAASDELLERGQYIFFAAGCIACHTADLPLAGGRAIGSPFGTFYSSNITPDEQHGIGGWTQDDLIRALREGISPGGEHYYPAFPYPSFTKMTREDIMALYAYIMAQPAVPRKNRAHELIAFLSNRALIAHWKRGRFRPGVLQPDLRESRDWNRGQYLAIALGHCTECHTPRDILGGPLTEQYLSGARGGPGGDQVPNITPDPQTGIGNWSHEELETFLSTGRKPDGCYTSGLMLEVLGTSCTRLTEDDRHALATYLQSLRPIHRDLEVTQEPTHAVDLVE